MAVGYGTDIIGKAREELKIEEGAIKNLPEVQVPVQEHIDNMIPPAAKFDQVVAEKTQAVNLKVAELQVLTALITSGGATGCGLKDGEGDPVGTSVSHDELRGVIYNAESTSYTGTDPWGPQDSNGMPTGRTAMTSGTGGSTTITTANLGVGSTTLAEGVGTFFAQASASADDDGNDCEITNGDSYDTAYPGHTGDLYSTRRTAIINEIAALRTERDNYAATTSNVLKKEIRDQFFQRYALIYGKNLAEIRKAELESLIDFCEDKDNDSFFAN
tara:strand:+ start:4065 stop:4883 length:819 start_codon:yes stop_codon:yes gene_type:complete